MFGLSTANSKLIIPILWILFPFFPWFPVGCRCHRRCRKRISIPGVPDVGALRKISTGDGSAELLAKAHPCETRWKGLYVEICWNYGHLWTMDIYGCEICEMDWYMMIYVWLWCGWFSEALNSICVHWRKAPSIHRLICRFQKCNAKQRHRNSLAPARGPKHSWRMYGHYDIRYIMIH